MELERVKLVDTPLSCVVLVVSLSQSTLCCARTCFILWSMTANPSQSISCRTSCSVWCHITTLTGNISSILLYKRNKFSWFQTDVIHYYKVKVMKCYHKFEYGGGNSAANEVMVMLGSILTDVLEHERRRYPELKTTTLLYVNFLLISPFSPFSHFPLRLVSCNGFSALLFLLMLLLILYLFIFPVFIHFLLSFLAFSTYSSSCLLSFLPLLYFFFFRRISSHFFFPSVFPFLRSYNHTIFVVVLLFLLLPPFLSSHFQKLFLPVWRNWAL